MLEATNKLNQAADLLPEGLFIRWVKAHVKRKPGEVFADGYINTFDPNDRADENARLASSGDPPSLVGIKDLPGKSLNTIKK